VGIVAPHVADDHVGELTLAAPPGFPFALVLGRLLGHVGIGRWMAAYLDDVHSMQLRFGPKALWVTDFDQQAQREDRADAADLGEGAGESLGMDRSMRSGLPHILSQPALGLCLMFEPWRRRAHHDQDYQRGCDRR
jgi:hypothetical protein